MNNLNTEYFSERELRRFNFNKVGKNVLLAANATILGNIKIGDNAKIGAGSDVINDIPENSTAVGVPARILKE